MSNIVYLMRFHRTELPNLYIGSKSNCKVVDGKMYGSRGLYEGSSRDPTFASLISSGIGYDLIVVGEFSNYDDALTAERAAHIRHDVVASPKFFNKSLALENTYSNPEYATYKHVATGKVARLLRSHPDVVAGEWVGVTKGRIMPDSERGIRSMPGAKNSFYGKSHDAATKSAISKANSAALKGKNKTHEHRTKLSEAAKRRWEAYRRDKANRQTEGL